PRIREPVISWMVPPLCHPSLRPEVLHVPLGVGDLRFAVGTLPVEDLLNRSRDLGVTIDVPVRHMVLAFGQSARRRLAGRVEPGRLRLDRHTSLVLPDALDVDHAGFRQRPCFSTSRRISRKAALSSVSATPYSRTSEASFRSSWRSASDRLSSGMAASSWYRLILRRASGP